MIPKQIRQLPNKELYELSSKKFDGELFQDFQYRVRMEIKRREKNAAKR